MRRAILAFVVLLFPIFVFGQVPFPQLSQPAASFAMEDKDWGIAPTTSPRKAPHGETPTTIPGARVIRTLELKGLLDSNKNVIVVDALGGKTRITIPGAVWIPGIGDGEFYAAEKSRFAAAMEKLTGGDKTKPIVFLCLSSECWLSYNASLHALEAGYQDVIWYRGGINAWTDANLELKKAERVNW